MPNNINRFLSPHQLGIPFVGLLLFLGVFTNRTQSALSNQMTHRESTVSARVIQPQTSAKNSVVTSQRAKFPKQDGVYLYGQSPQPNQIGQGYIVFEKRQGNVKGAMYMPRSEFSCFNGTVDSTGELAMTVTGYPGEVSTPQVATNSTIPRLVNDESTNYAYSVALQQYYPLNKVSANDHRILQMCKEQH